MARIIMLSWLILGLLAIIFMILGLDYVSVGIFAVQIFSLLVLVATRIYKQVKNEINKTRN